MFVKVGPVSFNSKTKKVNFDRRTIGKKGDWCTHLTYIVAGVATTAVVAAVLKK